MFSWKFRESFITGSYAIQWKPLSTTLSAKALVTSAQEAVLTTLDTCIDRLLSWMFENSVASVDYKLSSGDKFFIEHATILVKFVSGKTVVCINNLCGGELGPTKHCWLCWLVLPPSLGSRIPLSLYWQFLIYSQFIRYQWQKNPRIHVFFITLKDCACSLKYRFIQL